MSTQEQKLTAIADAIREKDGTTGPISANDFAARILAIQGGGDVSLESIAITAPPTKVSYKTGDLFDPTGMSVWAEFSNGYGLYVNHADLVFDPAGPLEEGAGSVTVRFSWGEETAEAAQAIGVSSTQIYGVEWDGTATTKWARTDDAAGFTDPVPYVAGATEYGSPFDEIMPWAGMVRETRAGGVEVKEPKYWFKWTKTGKKLKLQIANEPVDGFHVDPVNMDRGDGLGELDFSYIGRYHCGSDYKSTTNVAQKVSITRSTARSGIHGLGANFWQMDFAQFWYVGMLFLVEFADWNGERIGRGCSASETRASNGRTDAMKYHTGTTVANRDSYGFTQYRNIEGWWDNVFDWMDGCYYNSSGLNIIQNPNQFSDSVNGTLVGLPTDGYPTDFTIPAQSGLEWALFPCAAGGSINTYVPDGWGFKGSKPCLCHGGYEAQGANFGLFFVAYFDASHSGASVGCRLQERPPKSEEEAA